MAMTMPAPHDGFSGMPAFAGGKTVELARGSLASREKKTFKDKLLTLIQEAEAQEQQAMREAQMQDKKTLAIQLLVEGRPQAFTDFFNLTHPPPASAPKQAAMSSNQGDSGAESTSGQDHEVPQEALTFLSSELLRADNALRSGDLQTVYAAYKSLAKYFAQIGKLTKAEFFFQRCLGISQDGGWLAGELEANLALGVVYDELKDNASAIACYERRLDLAASHNLALQHDTAWTNLTAVYLRQAQVQESSGDANSALECYAHCLNAAAHAGDEATAARAHFRTGMLHFGAERYEEALQSLMRFMEVRGALGDKEAEGLAFTTFADCKMLLGDTDGAIHSLEQYLQTARGGDQQGAAMAACSLGNMFYEQKDLEQAVSYFERFFEIARTLKDRKMLDVARVNLGIARGTLRMDAYMSTVVSDLPQLIQWKNARIPFTDY